jgi:hypothetical protein
MLGRRRRRAGWFALRKRRWQRNKSGVSAIKAASNRTDRRSIGPNVTAAIERRRLHSEEVSAACMTAF